MLIKPPTGSLEYLAAERLTAFLPDDGATVCVAVSGGGDSLALLHLTSAWAREQGRKLHVLTVDHGLRAEAQQETAFVREVSYTLGWRCSVLKWRTDEAPQSSLQETARKARHALLCDEARRVGASAILLGHTFDDQLETFLIRAKSGSGWRGLSGTSENSVSPIWPEGMGIRMIRPLLNVRRNDLRRYLARHELEWVEDPSNEDQTYTRVRARNLLSKHPEIANSIERIQRDLVLLRASQDRAIGRLGRETVSFDRFGVAELDWTRLRSTPAAQVEVLLANLALCSSGRDFLPRSEQIRNVLNSLKNADNEPDFSMTCGGAWFHMQKGQLTVMRDPGGVDWALISLGGQLILDGRFSLHAPDLQPDRIRFETLDMQRLFDADRIAAKTIDPNVRKTLPMMVECDSGACIVPHLAGASDTRIMPLVGDRFWALLH